MQPPKALFTKSPGRKLVVWFLGRSWASEPCEDFLDRRREVPHEPQALSTATLGGMIEKKLTTTLIFGNVVLESTLTACYVRVYSDDKRSFSMSTNPPVELKVPLDELKKNASREQKEAIATHIFDESRHLLDADYPGGADAAAEEFFEWLCEV